MKMRGRSGSGGSGGQAGSPNLMLFWGFLVLVSNNLILPVASTATTTSNNNFGHQKNYYSSGAPSNPSHAPSHHGHGSKRHTSPSTSGGQSNCGVLSPSPPSSGGSGSGSGGCNCPTPPTPSGGSGGYYHHPPTPKTPSRKTPPTPLVPLPPYEPPVNPTPVPHPSSPPPSSGGSGGGYYGPPTTPTTPSTPLVPSPPFTLTPITPITPIPPITPITPAPPLIPAPLPSDPNSPPFSCTYWGSHPGLIFGVLGWWATVGGLFGMPTGAGTLPGLTSADTTLQDVLNSPRKDGYASLYREATAAFLNSMAAKNFPFSSNQVKTSVLSSLHSEKAAASQARLFRLANQGKLKAVAASNQP